MKKNEDITSKPKPKKSATATLTKKQTNEDLLIDFDGGASKIEAKKAASSSATATEDSWEANWENDAWESLNKKD